MNDGEFSKAERDIDGRKLPNHLIGNWVVNELGKKYPRREEAIKWPEIYEIEE